MRSFLPLALVTVAACSSSPQPAPTASPAPTGSPAATAAPTTSPAPSPAALASEKLAADTPKTTAAGNTFIAPSGWTMTVRGQATILEAPEAGNHIVLVDVKAKDADAALALAWAAYGQEPKWPLKTTLDAPDKDGWTRIRFYDYQTSPNEKRDVGVNVRFANDMWTVIIYDMAQAVGEKRASQTGLIYGRLLPKGRERESFAGKTANPLDQARIAELGKFVEAAQQKLGVPGVSIGLVQGGKVVFAGGFGVRELGKKTPVDADTKYIIASNTKALTTLMLAKLVDEKKLGWETTATSLLPSFKLGDADTTSRVLVKHLICACTGLPRQDLEWLFQWRGVTPEGAMTTLGTMQPTSKFGELFQYSNPLAAAAGFIGGHVVFPKLDLGRAYDEAMRTLVFEPLGMKSATFDFKRGQTGNYAVAHAPDVDGKPAKAVGVVNEAVIPVRPAGGAWSTVNDVLRYVQMELAEGKLPDGKQYISKEPLLARRAPQVALNRDASYGMGLMVDKKWGVTVVHHGGDMIGFHSDMMWLPEHGVGAVVLTNGDPGWLIRTIFQRKLLEVLFNGRPEADAEITTMGKMFFDQLAADRKLLTIPADAAESAKLAAHYTNAALGDVKVSRAGGATTFDFGEWKGEVASRKNPDGSISFLTITPGMTGLEFVVGSGEKKRTLTIRDAQHEYVFDEK
ncbi:serine hydrolase domain-containing protein [Polyangium spumosum]|uniref:Serine hydrolase n=1 Tax=Polyangium spumosum TaxID=889282 RepID=A0A6N7PV91_9BACT|nr:serine hydrolase domain-containing protein [Polyangium spumosum]MRG96152.1 serine hydrolase [Polyangium spumosum]